MSAAELQQRDQEGDEVDEPEQAQEHEAHQHVALVPREEPQKRMRARVRKLRFQSVDARVVDRPACSARLAHGPATSRLSPLRYWQSIEPAVPGPFRCRFDTMTCATLPLKCVSFDLFGSTGQATACSRFVLPSPTVSRL